MAASDDSICTPLQSLALTDDSDIQIQFATTAWLPADESSLVVLSKLADDAEPIVETHRPTSARNRKVSAIGAVANAVKDFHQRNH